jgi:hypothetical protein
MRREPAKTLTDANKCDGCKTQPWTVVPYFDHNGHDVNGKDYDEPQPKLRLCDTCFEVLEERLDLALAAIVSAPR